MRRAVRDSDARADRQAVEEDPGDSLRARLLVAGPGLEADGRVGRDRGAGHRAARLLRHAGRRVRAAAGTLDPAPPRASARAGSRRPGHRQDSGLGFSGRCYS